MSGSDNTSGRYKQAPGGNSTFSFGWGEETKETEEQRLKREELERKKKVDEEAAEKAKQESWKKALDEARTGNNKPRAPPGGASSISFG